MGDTSTNVTNTNIPINQSYIRTPTFLFRPFLHSFVHEWNKNCDTLILYSISDSTPIYLQRNLCFITQTFSGAHISLILYSVCACVFVGRYYFIYRLNDGNEERIRSKY